MIYTIHSNDDVMFKDYLAKIYRNNNIQADIMNTQEFDVLERSIDEILDYCLTTPFFSDYKICILKNPVFLTGESSKKDYSEFIEKLENYIDNENPSTILIIYANYDKLDERKKINKILKEKTNFKKLETPNPEQLAKIIIKMFENNNISINMSNALFIIDKVGTNLVDLQKEIEKLSLYKPNSTLNREDIEDFIVYDIDASIFDLSNAILEKNTVLALDTFDNLLAEGFEPIVLISVLANQLRIALMANLYQRQGYNQSDIAKKLKIHPYRVKLALKLKYSSENIKDILLKLADLDYQIKIGKINKHKGLKVLILNI